MLNSRRVWVEIDLPQLCENYRRIARAVAPCRVLAVLKANAYGLGVEPVARALAQRGTGLRPVQDEKRGIGLRPVQETKISFGVAEPHEAAQLLPLGKRVHLLSAVLPDEIEDMVRGNVTLPATDLETARLISAAACQLNRVATVHCKIDTGMGRLGILAGNAAETVRKIAKLPGLRLEGIFTHFPAAYEPEHPHTQQQVATFLTLLETLRSGGIAFDLVHAANSDAINNLPRAFQPPFNLVRAGLNLHGSFDPAGARNLDLRPVLTLKTCLAAVRTLPAGHPVGYGLTYRAPTAMRVGTISAGYADGLPLALSNRGFVRVHGASCPVLGRVSMDYTTVSLESVPHAHVGDEVVCLGSSPGAPTIEDWAALKQTHPYEIICSLGNRVQRVYKTQ